jgi:hypothetical protein
MAALPADTLELHKGRLISLTQETREAQDDEGLFRRPGEAAAFKHQNQMYTIWGLASVDLALGQIDSQASIARCLDYTVRERMRHDGGLLWHAYRGLSHRVYSTGRSLVDKTYTPEPNCLFSCHQAFFIYAADLYSKASADDHFEGSIGAAIDWLHGNNDAHQDVFRLSGIGLPWRLIRVGGAIDTPRQNFIGSYEIGGMLLALSSLPDIGGAP